MMMRTTVYFGLGCPGRRAVPMTSHRSSSRGTQTRRSLYIRKDATFHEYTIVSFSTFLGAYPNPYSGIFFTYHALEPRAVDSGASSRCLLGQEEGPQDTARTSQSEPRLVHDLVRPLRSWLQKCDESHDCRDDSRSGKFCLPARLLNGRPSGDPEQLLLDDASASEGDRYLGAVSLLGQARRRTGSRAWRTLAANLAARARGGSRSTSCPRPSETPSG
ncbi:hypothetical protein CTA2_11551 [Colletotrichum tanaceti]|uniref:Uncharacterized protein n=1 Tax=Colletotrichum tanaceti TaxID=1306861 RepID=A0A4U6X709_9PEZI|nr:hypothetical protein CTA2_11551 [Colletotrichum tanaceti]TKW51105.1 hypothetical protein CTA1_12219 [Colletotrichum tanaceti]